MFMKELCVVLVLWLSHTQASNWDHVRHTYIPVNITGRNCLYEHHNFSYEADTNETCEKLRCYAYERKVVKMTCVIPPSSCNLTLTGEFPDCCSHKCFNVSRNCLGSDNKLIEDGKNRSLVNPCRLEGCSGGIVTVLETCLGAGDSQCKPSLANETEPYPACCGAAVACTK
uniref:Putative 8.9 kDa family member n=1 Tax=Rhipicephalus pulchellus TaxID=72859 RepID=L7LPW8_RHIPC